MRLKVSAAFGAVQEDQTHLSVGGEASLHLSSAGETNHMFTFFSTASALKKDKKNAVEPLCLF